MAQTGTERDGETTVVYRTYARHWCGMWKTLDRIDSGTVAGYIRRRLGAVKRTTVLKELAALRMLLRWCREQQLPCMSAKDVNSPQRNVVGTSYAGKRHKPGAVVLTPAQVEALLDAVPEGRMRMRLRVMYETGLRPSTVARLRCPEHYKPGSTVLRITRDIDKARFERELDLSVLACDALDAACPEVGLIFGPNGKLNKHIRRAAKVAKLPAETIKWIGSYDFRHSRLTHWGDEGELSGVMYLAGHKHATTTARYMHANRDAARKLVRPDRLPAQKVAQRKARNRKNASK